VIPGKKISIDDFRFLKVLGRGTYGKVMLAQKIDSGQLFAAKVLRKDVIIANDSTEDAMTERDILIRVKVSLTSLVWGILMLTRNAIRHTHSSCPFGIVSKLKRNYTS